MQFQGFKPEAMQRIAGTLGYDGDMSQFDGYLEGNPEAKQKMGMYNQQAVNMMNGGMVRSNYAEGGVAQIKKDTIDRMKNPKLAPGAETKVVGTVATADQNIATGTGKLDATAPQGTTTSTGPTATATAAVAPGAPTLKDGAPSLEDFMSGSVEGEVFASDRYDDRAPIRAGEDPKTYMQDRAAVQKAKAKADYDKKYMVAGTGTGVNKVDPSLTGDKVEAELDKTTAATGEVSDDATIEAAETTESAVSKLEAAEGESVDVEAVAKRVLDIKETIDPVASAADAAKFTEEIEAATATPTEKATVKGQLAELMTDFEGGETPAWAAGALRAATTAMASRGLGSSSMAGQALVQAAMEASLPIAMADAGTFAKFESQNLSNRQQRAMLAAEQRATFMGQEFDQKFQARVMNAAKVSDVANMNFNAEQQVALENSRAANTMALANLSNEQALLMGEVAALANLDMANLSNRQQAKVLNAQSFLAMDMANLSNKQQTEMFKAQSRTQSLFSDQAAENAAKQFNATSQNQSDQFFANLKTQTSQFNASQTNAMDQFNAGETNSMSKFNAEIDNQRDQFNASNSLVIAQSNANWRREIATAGTAAVNRANEINAANVLGISNQAHANLWQEYGDLMEWAWTSAEGERDRQKDITLSHLAAGKDRTQAQMAGDLAASNAMGDLVGKLIIGGVGKFFNW